MNWDAIGAVGQVLGSIAVFVTLAYLAIQTRVAHSTASDTNRQQRAQGVRDMVITLATHEDLRSLWDGNSALSEVALAERLGVNKDEANRLGWACQYWCWLHWGQWASMTTDADNTELRHLIQTFYSVRPMSAFWELSPYVQLLDESFVAFVNEVLATAPPQESTQ